MGTEGTCPCCQVVRTTVGSCHQSIEERKEVKEICVSAVVRYDTVYHNKTQDLGPVLVYKTKRSRISDDASHC